MPLTFAGLNLRQFTATGADRRSLTASAGRFTRLQLNGAAGKPNTFWTGGGDMAGAVIQSRRQLIWKINAN